MLLNEQMRLIVCLLLSATACLCIESESNAIDDGGLRSFEEAKGERFFLSSFKTWLLGQGTKEKKMSTTQIKVLPVYIPVPLYQDGKIPLKKHYGAYQNMQGYNKPTNRILPYTYGPQQYSFYPSQSYQSHGQTLPYYFKEYDEQFPQQYTIPIAYPQADYSYSYDSIYPQSYFGYAPSNQNVDESAEEDDSQSTEEHDTQFTEEHDSQSNEEHDSIVIDNPDIATKTSGINEPMDEIVIELNNEVRSHKKNKKKKSA